MSEEINELFNLEHIDLKGGYVLRALRINDYDKNFLELLSQLTKVGPITREQFDENFRAMKAAGVYYIVVVADATGKLVGTGSLIVERKFTHHCGQVGHIEDVVTDSTVRGAGIGKALITRLTALAHSLGCYKTILDTAEDNVEFYVKCGYKRKEIQMAHYFEHEHHAT